MAGELLVLFSWLFSTQLLCVFFFFFFFQAEDGIRDKLVTGVQTCALPISRQCLLRGRGAASGGGRGAAAADRGHPAGALGAGKRPADRRSGRIRFRAPLRRDRVLVRHAPAVARGRVDLPGRGGRGDPHPRLSGGRPSRGARRGGGGSPPPAPPPPPPPRRGARGPGRWAGGVV